jgi:hypothetical protein
MEEGRGKMEEKTEQKRYTINAKCRDCFIASLFLLPSSLS